MTDYRSTALSRCRWTLGGSACSVWRTFVDMLEMLSAWAEQAKKLEAGEITREDYDRWRYNYPKYDTTRKWVKVPSKELSDFLVEAFKDRLGKD